jgi:hypothetical protein
VQQRVEHPVLFSTKRTPSFQTALFFPLTSTSISQAVLVTLQQQVIHQSQKEVCNKNLSLYHFFFFALIGVVPLPPTAVISRVFLCLAIANAVRRGRVSLECPIAPRAYKLSGQRAPC